MSEGGEMSPSGVPADVWTWVVQFVQSNVWEIVLATASLVLGVFLQQVGEHLTRPRGDG